MRLSVADQRRFPRLTEYVRRRMPEVLNVPVIVRNMRRFGSLTRAELAHALTWGTDPLILIVDHTANTCGGTAAVNGCFRPTNPDRIELNDETVNNFETDPYGAGSDVNARGQKLFIVGTTILHELCHWGNFKHGVAEVTEQGVAFEVATYGRNTG
jgi:hypothetical protein